MPVGQLPVSVIRDAMGVAGGLYRMNAKYAQGYAFSVAPDKKQVGCGEFVYAPDECEGHDGYIDFTDNTVRCLATGKMKELCEM